MSSPSFFILAGEASGDAHGSWLLRALYRHSPAIHVWGVGGPKMRKEGMEIFLPMEEFQLMGFVEIIGKLPKAIRQGKMIVKEILRRKPDKVVLIDYPGLNLRIAKALKKKGYQGKIVQYISPTVWAWKKGRIDTMASSLDKLLTIYPFENALFSHTTLQAAYVGNPVLEEMVDDETAEEENLVALFPGSREGEVRRNLPHMLKSVSILLENRPGLRFEISSANADLLPLIQSHTDLPINTSPSYKLMQRCRAAIAVSGTVTLELALRKKPSVVLYQIPFYYRPLAQLILKPRIKHICIVNILGKKEIFPEFTFNAINPVKVAVSVEGLLNGPSRSECLQGCIDVIDLIGPNKAGEMAAKELL